MNDMRRVLILICILLGISGTLNMAYAAPSEVFIKGVRACNISQNTLSPELQRFCDRVTTDCEGSACDVDLDGDGFTQGGGDCDDGDPSSFPGAVETCDGLDNNCDGAIDEDILCDVDSDYDGFSTGDGDCDDYADWIYPGAPETCNYIDDDCDGLIDEGSFCDTDADADGFTTSTGDCDDSDANTYPGAVEICDGLDNNCDSMVDEFLECDTDFLTSPT